MTKLLAILHVVFVVSIGWTQFVFAQQAPIKAAPVDFRACNFRDGQGMDDLDKISAKFREYANKNDFAYAAWTLTPQYHNGSDFDVGWLGAWPDGVAFGVSMEKWNTTGRELQAEFNQVVDCSSRHEMAASLPINAPDGTPEDGVLMFYECTLHDGKTLDEAYASHLKAGMTMKALGSLAVSWMFQPAAGAGDIDFDYYHVVGFYRYSDMGATMEMYANGGGKREQQKILGGISSCATPVIFDALSVRAYDER
jgi:hypothetical protein